MSVYMSNVSLFLDANARVILVTLGLISQIELVAIVRLVLQRIAATEALVRTELGNQFAR